MLTRDNNEPRDAVSLYKLYAERMRRKHTPGVIDDISLNTQSLSKQEFK